MVQITMEMVQITMMTQQSTGGSRERYGILDAGRKNYTISNYFQIFIKLSSVIVHVLDDILYFGDDVSSSLVSKMFYI